MKNHIKFLLFFICAFFASTLITEAETCPNSILRELNQTASHIKMDIETVDESTVKELVAEGNKSTYTIPKFKFIISIYNITPDVYISLTTSNKSRELNIYYNDTTDGTYTFEDDDFGNIYNYELKVIAANEVCNGTSLRTLRKTKPRYNAYSEYSYCKNSSSFYCQKFVSTDIRVNGIDDFMKKVGIKSTDSSRESTEKIENNEEESIGTILKSNWILYLSIAGGVVVVVIVIIVLVSIRKKNRRAKL